MRVKNRQEMVAELIEDDIEWKFTSVPFIKELMRKGFKGYDNMTDEEITVLWKAIQL